MQTYIFRFAQMGLFFLLWLYFPFPPNMRNEANTGTHKHTKSKQNHQWLNWMIFFFMLVFPIGKSRSLIFPDYFFPSVFEILFFLFVWLKASLLAWSWSIRWVDRVGCCRIYSFRSIIGISDRKKSVSVGIYDEELWWQRDRWERCLWPGGFSSTTMKKMKGKKCVLVWHNKSNGLGREGWNELRFDWMPTQCKRRVVHLVQIRYFLIFTPRTAGKEGNEESLVISWKKQINNFGVVWLWLNRK